MNAGESSSRNIPQATKDSPLESRLLRHCERTKNRVADRHRFGVTPRAVLHDHHSLEVFVVLGSPAIASLTVTRRRYLAHIPGWEDEWPGRRCQFVDLALRQQVRLRSYGPDCDCDGLQTIQWCHQ